MFPDIMTAYIEIIDSIFFSAEITTGILLLKPIFSEILSEREYAE